MLFKMLAMALPAASLSLCGTELKMANWVWRGPATPIMTRETGAPFGFTPWYIPREASRPLSWNEPFLVRVKFLYVPANCLCKPSTTSPGALAPPNGPIIIQLDPCVIWTPAAPFGPCGAKAQPCGTDTVKRPSGSRYSWSLPADGALGAAGSAAGPLKAARFAVHSSGVKTPATQARSRAAIWLVLAGAFAAVGGAALLGLRRKLFSMASNAAWSPAYCAASPPVLKNTTSPCDVAMATDIVSGPARGSLQESNR